MESSDYISLCWINWPRSHYRSTGKRVFSLIVKDLSILDWIWSVGKWFDSDCDGFARESGTWGALGRIRICNKEDSRSKFHQLFPKKLYTVRVTRNIYIRFLNLSALTSCCAQNLAPTIITDLHVH